LSYKFNTTKTITKKNIIASVHININYGEIDVKENSRSEESLFEKYKLKTIAKYQFIKYLGKLIIN